MLNSKSYSTLYPDDRFLHDSESDIRQIQRVQLRMLRVLDAVCKDYGITYWLDAGTLLGAIRHQGFIPWDDDLDVVMPRPDYERFLQIAPKVFCEDIFFQNNQITDPDYNFFWSKLRDRRSTAMDDFECAEPAKYHMGIALDVFCFDGCDDLSTYYRRKRFMNYDYPNKKKRLVMRLLRNIFTLFVPKSMWIRRLNQQYASRYDSSPYLIKSFDCIFTGHFHKTEVFPLAEAKFEGYSFPVPGNWNLYLRTCYGDYMQLPPESERHYQRHFKQVDLYHACDWDKKNLINKPADYLYGNFFVGETKIPSLSGEQRALEEVSLHLVYVYFGSREDHIRQIRMSISSWVERSNVGVCVHLVTDQAVLMERFLVDLKLSQADVLKQVYLHEISNEILIEWMGKHHFSWRIKMKALEYVQKQFPAISLLYLDGDTYLRHSAASLYAKLNNGIPLMHMNEGALSKKRSKTERLMWTKMNGSRVWEIKTDKTGCAVPKEVFLILKDTCMWNAGLIGLPADSAEYFIRASIGLCDAWLDAGIRPRLLEQFAFSVVLSATGHLEAADDQVGHYWNNKSAFNF